MATGFGAGLGNFFVDTNANAQTTINNIDGILTNGINNLNQRRATLGAFVNQLQSAASNLSTATENLSAANARIRDVDVASETAKLTQAQVLQQSAALVLAQANTAPNIALQLLKGG